MEADVSYTPERLDHLGIVAGICHEIGLADWLDEQAKGSRQRVSVGTATLAMVLNGLGFSNRRLYLVGRFFENKPIKQLLPRDAIEPEDLNDDCLGRTLDWLYDRDVTVLFAGIAQRAREIFEIEKRHIHVDTTSFCVCGEYDTDPQREGKAAKKPEEEEEEEEEATPAELRRRRRRRRRREGGPHHPRLFTRPPSRPQAVDVMALGTTTHEGDVPLFMRPLDGNSSDKVTLVDAVEALKEQLRDADDGDDADEEASIFVADSGLYSEANMLRLAEAGVRWVSRVPETSKMARSIVDPDAPDWHSSSDGRLRWYRREVKLGEEEKERTECWVVVSGQEAEERARKTLLRRMHKERERWEGALRRGLTRREFACEADAKGALASETEHLPAYFEVEEASLEATAHYGERGRPKNGREPTSTSWRIVFAGDHLSVDEEQLEREWRRRACYIVGTNVLDPEILSEEESIATYKGQGSVERGGVPVP